jgi:hypothetical protein
MNIRKLTFKNDDTVTIRHELMINGNTQIMFQNKTDEEACSLFKAMDGEKSQVPSFEGLDDGRCSEPIIQEWIPLEA